ncbi:hypothetical protein, partial [Ralstonia solanacearum]|uniref:hypothetical protein n=1 Tax=Ralstonia solanacearum TaxID=305 RepID=UPI001E4C24A6
PIGERGGINLYSYVNGNPTGFVDPLGLAKQDPNSAYCRNLRQKIDNVRKDLDKRWEELAADGQGLPEYIGPGERFYQTRRGHRTIIKKADRNLRGLESQYDDECGGPPPPPAPAACPDEKKSSVPNWVKAVGAGAAATGAVACAFAEPCGAIVGGAAVLGGTAAAATQ